MNDVIKIYVENQVVDILNIIDESKIYHIHDFLLNSVVLV